MSIQDYFEIDIDNFFARILPSVDDAGVTKVLESLRASGTLDEHTNRWVHFKDAGMPKDQLGSESAAFKPIGDLAREITKAIQDSGLNKEVQFIYDSRPEPAPELPESDNSTQPDGYFVVKSAATDWETFKNLRKPRWRNLTLISEFEKANTAKARNDVRVCSPCASLADDCVERVQSSLGNEAHNGRGPL